MAAEVGPPARGAGRHLHGEASRTSCRGRVGTGAQAPWDRSYEALGSLAPLPRRTAQREGRAEGVALSGAEQHAARLASPRRTVITVPQAAGPQRPHARARPAAARGARPRGAPAAADDVTAVTCPPRRAGPARAAPPHSPTPPLPPPPRPAPPPRSRPRPRRAPSSRPVPAAVTFSCSWRRRPTNSGLSGEAPPGASMPAGPGAGPAVCERAAPRRGVRGWAAGPGRADLLSRANESYRNVCAGRSAGSRAASTRGPPPPGPGAPLPGEASHSHSHSGPRRRLGPAPAAPQGRDGTGSAGSWEPGASRPPAAAAAACLLHSG